MSKRILIVEDEKNLARFVSLELQHEGYDVVTADNGREGLELALEKDFDLILLDLMLPEMDGFELCRTIRKQGDLPIVMLTARGEVMDRVVGLELGADDYLPKPFAMAELEVRIAAILRRVAYERRRHEPAVDGGLRFDESRGDVCHEGQWAQLTLTEFRLL